MNQSKTLGYILIGVGAIILLLGIVWAVAANLSGGGLVLAIIFAFVIGGPLVGIGLYTLNKGAGEAVEEAQIKRQQKLLSMVMTQGKVDVSSAAIELNITRDQTKAIIYDLIGKQLFSGYVDWDAGMLYSTDAAKLKDGTCPKCGGKLELAGKGLVKCPYCGSEVFLNA